MPANFNLITGQATNTMKIVVAGIKLKKTNAFQEIADCVNLACSTNWDRDIAKSRYESYLKSYKTTKALICGEKFMIGSKDTAKGINTLKEKAESLCTYFDRMDLLYGSRQNVVPSYVMETGQQALAAETGAASFITPSNKKRKAESH